MARRSKMAVGTTPPDVPGECPHPSRDGRHEVYSDFNTETGAWKSFCRACGADSNGKGPGKRKCCLTYPWEDHKETCFSAPKPRTVEEEALDWMRTFQRIEVRDGQTPIALKYLRALHAMWIKRAEKKGVEKGLMTAERSARARAGALTKQSTSGHYTELQRQFFQIRSGELTDFARRLKEKREK